MREFEASKEDASSLSAKRFHTGQQPVRQARPIDYASDTTPKSDTPVVSPHAVRRFVQGMGVGLFSLFIVEQLSIGRGESDRLVLILLALVPIAVTPVVLLRFDRTRMIGLGWIAMLLLAFFAATIVCGMK